MTNEKHDQRTPDDLEALLPWHAVGRLGGDDARRVDEALARDPELARRYALVAEERDETIALNEALGAPSARTHDRLFERIEAASPARSASQAAAGGGWLDAIIAALSPRGLAFATAALAIVALVQAGALTTLLVSDGVGERYGTASGPQAEDNAAFVFVAFALSRRAGWDIGFTLVTLVCGTVPILSFWAERRATRRARAEMAQAQPVAL